MGDQRPNTGNVMEEVSSSNHRTQQVPHVYIGNSDGECIAIIEQGFEGEEVFKIALKCHSRS